MSCSIIGIAVELTIVWQIFFPDWKAQFPPGLIRLCLWDALRGKLSAGAGRCSCIIKGKIARLAKMVTIGFVNAVMPLTSDLPYLFAY